jgi:hypothetical protein
MKKIMFNDSCGLTQAVLEGRKTMTRRVMSIDFYNCLDMKAYDDGDMECFMDRDGDFIDFRYTTKTPYQLGEVVAVAQSYRALSKAGNAAPEWLDNTCESSAGYNNKMFVRAELMPHRIKITDIRLQRQNNISDEECMREGVVRWMNCYIVAGIMENRGRNNVCFDTPREAFAALIDRINGNGTWDRNPWVFAYTFELLR